MTNLFLTSLVLAMIGLQGCSDESKIDIIQQMASPDGSLVATVFKIRGDATVALGVDVYLGGKGDLIPDYGNIFRGNHSEKAQVSWIDNKNLVISTDAEVFLLEKEYKGVTIKLRKK